MSLIRQTCAREIPELLSGSLTTIIHPMLFTIGKIFFPRLLHRERELRTRMRWMAVSFGLILVVGVVAVIGYVHKTRLHTRQIVTPVSARPPQ